MALGGISLGVAVGQILVETNKAVANINQLHGSLHNFAQQVQTVGVGLQTLTRNLLGIGLALGGVLVGAGKIFTDFETGMRNVASLSEVFAADIEGAMDSVLRLATETARSPAELAAALYEIVSAGQDGAAALDILTAAANAANAGLTSTANAANVLTGILNSGIQSSTHGFLDAASASDVFFKIVDRGVFTAEELAGQLGDNISLAASLGVTIEDLGTAYAVLTQQSVPLNEATTQINGVMKALFDPTQEMIDLLAAHNFQSGIDLIGQHGLGGAMQLLFEWTNGETEELLRLTNNIRAQRGIITLTSGEMENWNREHAEMADSLGATERALNEQQKALSFYLRTLLVVGQVGLIEFFKPLVPAIKALTEVLKILIEAFIDLPDGMKEFISIVTAISAGVFLFAGGIAFLLSQLYTIRVGLAGLGIGFSAIVAPILFLIGLITTLTYLFKNNVAGIRDFANGIKQILSVFGLLGGSLLSDDLENSTNALTGLKAALTPILGPAGAAGVRDALEGIREPTRRLVKQFIRLKNASINFLHILTGPTPADEVGRFHDRLDALFGPKLGGRILASTFRLRVALIRFGAALKETFGIDVSRLGLAKSIIDGIEQFGSFEEFVRQKVIPELGRNLEKAINGTIDVLDTLSVKLPIISEDFRSLWENIQFGLRGGGFDLARQSLNRLVEDIFGPVDLPAMILSIGEFFFTTGADVLSNIGSFINDVLAGMGFDVQTSASGGTFGYTLGKVIADVAEWGIEGAKDLGEKIKNYALGLIGAIGDGTEGPEGISVTMQVGKITADILDWGATSAIDLGDRLVNYVGGLLGVEGSDPTAWEVALAAGQGIGKVTVGILEWSFDAAEGLLSSFDTFWQTEKRGLEQIPQEIKNITVSITDWIVNEAEEHPKLLSRLGGVALTIGAATLAAPLGIPAIFVTVGAAFVTNVGDITGLVLTFIRPFMDTDGDGEPDIPLSGLIVNIIDATVNLIEGIGPAIASEAKEEIDTLGVAVDDYNGWTVFLGNPDVELSPSFDAARFIRDIFTALFGGIRDLLTVSENTQNEMNRAGEGLGRSLGRNLFGAILGGIGKFFSGVNLDENDFNLGQALVLMAEFFVLGLIDGVGLAIRDALDGTKFGELLEFLGDEFGDALMEGLDDPSKFLASFKGAIDRTGVGNLAGLMIDALVDAIFDPGTWANAGGIGLRGIGIIDDATGGLVTDALGPDSLVHAVVTAFEGLAKFLFDDEAIDEAIEGVFLSIGRKIRAAWEFGDPDTLFGLNFNDLLIGMEDALRRFFAPTLEVDPGQLISEGIIGPSPFDSLVDTVVDAILLIPNKIKEGIGEIDWSAIQPFAGFVDAITASWQAVVDFITSTPGLAEIANGDFFGAVRAIFSSIGGDGDGDETFRMQSTEGDIQISEEEAQRLCNATGVCPPGMEPTNGPGKVLRDMARGKGFEFLRNAARVAKSEFGKFSGDVDKATAFARVARGADPLAALKIRLREGLGKIEVRDPLANIKSQLRGGLGRVDPGAINLSGIDAAQIKIQGFIQAVTKSAPIVKQVLVENIGQATRVLPQLAQAFSDSGKAVDKDFAPTIRGALQRANAEGNLQFAAMTLRVVLFGQQLAVAGNSAMREFQLAISRGMLGAAQVMQFGLAILRSVVSGFSLYLQGFLIGASLGQGIAAGILSGVAAAANAARNLVLSVELAGRAKAEIGSPSRLMAREIGIPLAQGVAEGMRLGTPLAAAASVGLIEAAVAARNNAAVMGAVPLGIGGLPRGGDIIHATISVTIPVDRLQQVIDVADFFDQLPRGTTLGGRARV